MPSLPRIRIVSFVLLAAAAFTALQNWAFFRHLHQALSTLDHVNAGFVLSVPVFLVALLNLLLIPLSTRGLVKPLFAVLFIVGAMTSYSAFHYGTVFDRGMVQNIIETHSAEVWSYLTADAVIWVLLTGVLPATLLCLVHIEYPRTWWQGLLLRLGAMLVSVLVISLVALGFYQDYASVGRNNPQLKDEILPAAFVINTLKHVHRHYLSTPPVFEHIALDATRAHRAGMKPTLFLLVIGETARAQNFGMNGYARDTTPYTRAAGDVIAFQHVTSCGTATAVSVPCMLSRMTRAEFNDVKARNSDSLLDILHRTGIDIYWKDNDDGCKGACARVPNHTVTEAEHPDLCDGECLDMVLLRGLEEQIDRMKGDRMLVLHLIGSHGPTYFKRYPPEFRRFVPDCPRSDIENCSREALVNSYDNTIVYTDYVVSQLIQMLRRYSSHFDTGLLYLSDHGESLGESGVYLHGVPYPLAPKEQTHIPMQLWLSPALMASRQIDRTCLQQAARTGQFSQDNLFPSLLGLWDVRTSVYDPALDLFRPCRPAQKLLDDPETRGISP